MNAAKHTFECERLKHLHVCLAAHMCFLSLSSVLTTLEDKWTVVHAVTRSQAYINEIQLWVEHLEKAFTACPFYFKF